MKEITKRWDPVGFTPNEVLIQKKNEAILEKFEKYKKHPRRFLIIIFLSSIPGVTALLIVFCNPSLFYNLFFLYLFHLLLASLLIPFNYWNVADEFQRNVMKIIFSEEKNWLYNLEPSFFHMEQLEKKFTNLFKKEEGNWLQNEFWGNFEGTKKTNNYYLKKAGKNSQNINFYSGTLRNQDVAYRPRKKNIFLSPNNKIFFIIPLNKKLKTEFRLEQNTPPNKIKQVFSKKDWNKDFDLESNKFNKIFNIYYAGKKDEKVFEIVKTLSPKIITQLIELAKKEYFSLIFKEDYIIFKMHGEFIEKIKTKFWFNIKIYPEDKKFFENRINNILDISSEMVKYLD